MTTQKQDMCAKPATDTNITAKERDRSLTMSVESVTRQLFIR